MSPVTVPDDLTACESATWQAFRTAGRLVMDRLDHQLRTDSGIPHAHYEVLVRLSEAPKETLRMSALAAASLCSRSRLSHAVRRLEERGWVRRTSCPTDRRGQFAELTAAGTAALEAAAPGHVAAVRAAVFGALTTDQLARLREASESIVAHSAPETI